MPVDKKLPCVVCNKRKRRFVNNTCPPCNALIAAEKTHDKVGVPKESPTRQRWRVEAEVYNKLIEQRLSQRQIAEIMGYTYSQLRNHVNRWRTRGGLKVRQGWANRIHIEEAKVKPATAKPKPRRKIGHGEGRWGIKDCTCEPCKAVYKVSRAKHAVEYRARRKKLRQEKKQQTPS